MAAGPDSAADESAADESAADESAPSKGMPSTAISAPDSSTADVAAGASMNVGASPGKIAAIAISDWLCAAALAAARAAALAARSQAARISCGFTAASHSIGGGSQFTATASVHTL